jgi:hypothetical protein
MVALGYFSHIKVANIQRLESLAVVEHITHIRNIGGVETSQINGLQI